jgi:hypothetical protein
MATITFDGPAKIMTIGYDSAITNITAVELYSRWKDWVAVGNAQYVPAFAESVGGNDLGSGVGLGQYVFFQNGDGWRITGVSQDYEIRIVGDLYFSSPNGAAFNLVPGKSVIFSIQRSVGSTIVSSEGGSAIDPDDIAQAVWDRPMTSHTINNSFGKRVRELFPLHWGVR